MNFMKTKDGTRLYFKDWGMGRPVILIHGIHDKIVPINASGRPAANGISNSILKEYKGAARLDRYTSGSVDQ